MRVAEDKPSHPPLLDRLEGRRRLIEATREAARWHTPKRRYAKAAQE